jgi:hypothetical protein
VQVFVALFSITTTVVTRKVLGRTFVILQFLSANEAQRVQLRWMLGDLRCNHSIERSRRSTADHSENSPPTRCCNILTQNEDLEVAHLRMSDVPLPNLRLLTILLTHSPALDRVTSILRANKHA